MTRLIMLTKGWLWAVPVSFKSLWAETVFRSVSGAAGRWGAEKGMLPPVIENILKRNVFKRSWSR